jgi:hypothetical protein
MKGIWEMIDYKEFLDRLSDNDIYYLNGISGEYIKVKWVVGGTTGRSCWGGEFKSKPIDELEDEPDFDKLDAILELFCPNITYLQYKKLTNELVKYSEYNDGGDWYGNYYEYKVKTVNLKELFEYINANT